MKVFSPEKLKNQMNIKLYTPKSLAKELRFQTGSLTTCTQVGGWLSGRILPSANNLGALSAALGVPLDTLYEEVDL